MPRRDKSWFSALFPHCSNYHTSLPLQHNFYRTSGCLFMTFHSVQLVGGWEGTHSWWWVSEACRVPVCIRLLDQVSVDHWQQLSHTLASLQWLSQVTLLAHNACGAYINSRDLLIQTNRCGLQEGNSQRCLFRTSGGYRAFRGFTFTRSMAGVSKVGAEGGAKGTSRFVHLNPFWVIVHFSFRQHLMT